MRSSEVASVEVDDSEVSSEEDEDESSQIVRGRVFAYLPPSADEPMALWKIKLEGDMGFQDLELNELETALQLYLSPA